MDRGAPFEPLLKVAVRTNSSLASPDISAASSMHQSRSSGIVTSSMLSSLAQSRCNIGDSSVRGIVLFLLVLPALLLFVGESPAQQPQVPAEQPQQPRVIDRSVKVQAGKDTRIAVFVTIRNDCTAGPLPTIKLQLAPTRGKVSIKSAKVRATNLKHCLAIEVPGYVAFYRVDAEFAGTEVVELEVIEASGNRKLERLTITVGKTNRGENI